VRFIANSVGILLLATLLGAVIGYTQRRGAP